MKRIAVLLLLLPVLVLSARAADVQSLMEELPSVNVLQEMDMEAQREVYDKTQAAYDAYMALSDGEKAELEEAEETFESLFGYFNTLTMPLEEAPEEPGTGSDILSTVVACAIGLLLARKIVTKRKL